MSTIDPANVSIEDIDDTREPTVGGYAAETRAFETPTPPVARTSPSIRQSLRQDLSAGRAWAGTARVQTERAIRAQPVRAAAYAAGAGLVLGLLLRR